jgi:hypothetical protein
VRWPFVTAATMDALIRANDALSTGLTQLISERDWLRVQLASALDHNRRMERIEAKVHETPIPHRQPREPMPAEVRDAIDAWDSEDTRSRLEADAWRLYERTQDWGRVKDALAAS